MRIVFATREDKFLRLSRQKGSMLKAFLIEYPHEYMQGYINCELVEGIPGISRNPYSHGLQKKAWNFGWNTCFERHYADAFYHPNGSPTTSRPQHSPLNNAIKGTQQRHP